MLCPNPFPGGKEHRDITLHMHLVEQDFDFWVFKLCSNSQLSRSRVGCFRHMHGDEINSRQGPPHPTMQDLDLEYICFVKKIIFLNTKYV